MLPVRGVHGRVKQCKARLGCQEGVKSAWGSKGKPDLVLDGGDAEQVMNAYSMRGGQYMILQSVKELGISPYHLEVKQEHGSSVSSKKYILIGYIKLAYFRI